MNLSSVSILVSWILRMTYSMSAEGLCRHLTFTNPVQGVALEGHVIKNISIGIYESCKHLCTMESHCLSFNLGPPVMGRMVCELSDSDVTKHPGDHKPRKGFIYRGTENYCGNNPPCQNKAKCQSGFTDKGYRCLCTSGFKGEHCEKDNWEKINDAPVCFGARDDTYGTFKIKKSGLIYTFKLVHKNGSLTCSTDYTPTHWGCNHPVFGNNTLHTVITFPNKTALLLADYQRYDLNCAINYSYQITGININSTELVFNNLPTPQSVSIGQEFQIWFGQDLTDCSEENNAGKTCADVYAWYA